MAAGALQSSAGIASCSGPAATTVTHRFPEILRACEKLPADTLIDGEVIVLDENGRCTFNALQHSRPRGHIQLYAFDLLVHCGR
jgi:ATP-dependent DNA ligase